MLPFSVDQAWGLSGGLGESSPSEVLAQPVAKSSLTTMVFYSNYKLEYCGKCQGKEFRKSADRSSDFGSGGRGGVGWGGGLWRMELPATKLGNGPPGLRPQTQQTRVRMQTQGTKQDQAVHTGRSLWSQPPGAEVHS